MGSRRPAPPEPECFLANSTHSSRCAQPATERALPRATAVQSACFGVDLDVLVADTVGLDVDLPDGGLATGVHGVQEPLHGLDDGLGPGRDEEVEGVVRAVELGV